MYLSHLDILLYFVSPSRVHWERLLSEYRQELLRTVTDSVLAAADGAARQQRAAAQSSALAWIESSLVTVSNSFADFDIDSVAASGRGPGTAAGVHTLRKSNTAKHASPANRGGTPPKRESRVAGSANANSATSVGASASVVTTTFDVALSVFVCETDASTYAPHALVPTVAQSVPTVTGAKTDASEPHAHFESDMAVLTVPLPAPAPLPALPLLLSSGFGAIDALLGSSVDSVASRPGAIDARTPLLLIQPPFESSSPRSAVSDVVTGSAATTGDALAFSGNGALPAVTLGHSDMPKVETVNTSSSIGSSHMWQKKGLAAAFVKVDPAAAGAAFIRNLLPPPPLQPRLRRRNSNMSGDHASATANTTLADSRDVKPLVVSSASAADVSAFGSAYVSARDAGLLAVPCAAHGHQMRLAAALARAAQAARLDWAKPLVCSQLMRSHLMRAQSLAPLWTQSAHGSQSPLTVMSPSGGRSGNRPQLRQETALQQLKVVLPPYCPEPVPATATAPDASKPEAKTQLQSKSCATFVDPTHHDHDIGVFGLRAGSITELLAPPAHTQVRDSSCHAARNNFIKIYNDILIAHITTFLSLFFHLGMDRASMFSRADCNAGGVTAGGDRARTHGHCAHSHS